MDRKRIRIIIETIVKKLISGYNPEKIVLFGSFAKGNWSEDSDIDILVVKNGEAKRRVDRYIEVMNLIFDPALKIPISPLVLSGEEIEERLAMGDDFIREITTKGKVIYERRDS